MPTVEIRLFGNLRNYLPPSGDGPSAQVEVAQSATVGELLDQLKVPPPEDPKIILLNGVHAKREELLGEGDRVSVFPPVAGG